MMAAVQLGLLIILLTAQVQTGLSSCPVIDTVLTNNWPEDNEGIMKTVSAPGVTDVSWEIDSSDMDHYDASSYVDVTFNDTSAEIEFTPLPNMAGVRDFPSPASLAKMFGSCLMECGNDTGNFTYTAYIQDRNTASPVFNPTSYTVNVKETFPENIIIPDLTISASDADAEVTNNELSFTLQGDSPFELTPAEKTDATEATYTTQLKLKQPLDWATSPSYQLTITAKDPGGKTANATITVTVEDVDNMQPEFEQLTYSTTVEDPKLPAPLNVTINATDPDCPGSLKYTLTDTTGGQWGEYFSLDQDTAELTLTKDITDQLQTYPTTATFLIQATEDGGNHFYCRSALVVSLPAMDLTTTTEPPTSSTMMSTSSDATSSTSPVTSPSSTDTTVTTPMTSPSTSPDTTPSTPVTSPASTDTTMTTPITPTSTTPVTVSASTDTTASPMTSPSSGDTTVTSAMTSTSTTPVTPSSAPTPSPSPSPCPIMMFTQRQYLASTTESYTGDVINVTADSTAGDVTYFLRTPGYEDSFDLDEDSGTLSKLKNVAHERVSLLVQAVPLGESAKNQTNNTNVVDWDETLIIVDIADENDSPPVLDCSAYADSCDSIVIGFPASETAALPTPLLRLTATDADTGAFGVDGIGFTVDSSALKIDSSGMLYLLSQKSDPFSATVTAKDNNGAKPFLKDTAQITLVPVRDDQIFYVSTDSQLTDVDSVTSLLRKIADAGQYQTVLSLDFQPISTADKIPTQVGLADDDDGSAIYIYALRTSDTTFVAVDSDDMKKSLDKTETDVEYIETKDDQKTGGGGPGDSSSDTGLIVAVAVLACLLVAVIVAAGIRQRQLARRPAGNYARQNNDVESYNEGLKNPNYSPSAPRREGAATTGATYSNYAYQPSEQPVAPAVGSGSSHVYESMGHDGFTSGSSQPTEPPASTSATLIDIDEPTSSPPAVGGPAPEASEAPEATPAPDEPKPDYSLKSVGFKETVICVTPPEEHHEEEDEGDAEEEEEGAGEEEVEDAEKAGEGEDAPQKTHPSVQEGEQRPADDSESDNDSML